MTKERKSMSDGAPADEQDLQTRRDFLIGLGKWSKVVVATAVLGSSLVQRDAAAGWLNRRGGGTGWLNNRSGGGWINRRGGGGWLNRR